MLDNVTSKYETDTVSYAKNFQLVAVICLHEYCSITRKVDDLLREHVLREERSVTPLDQIKGA